MKTTDVTLAQANAITQSRYNFTVIEKRAIYVIIREVRRRYVEEDKGEEDLIDDLEIRIDTADLLKTDSSLRDIYAALNSLRNKSIYIEDKNRVLGVGYINYFDHQKREPYIEIQVSHKILPYLVLLAENFTSYNLTVAISLKTKYAQRFYEFCSQWEQSGFFVLSQAELRKKLALENTYSRWALFEKYVLQVAQKELKKAFEVNQCNLCFTYHLVKSGRTVTQIKFFIKSNKAEQEALKPDDLVYHIRTWLSSWLHTSKRPKNKLWVDGVITHIQLNPDLIPQLYARLSKLVKEEPGQNHAAIARHIISEDFMP